MAISSHEVQHRLFAQFAHVADGLAHGHRLALLELLSQGERDVESLANVTGLSVYRDPDDANVLIVTHNFNDLNSALAFANSEDLKAAMGRAGVAGRPEFWFGEELEHTNY